MIVLSGAFCNSAAQITGVCAEISFQELSAVHVHWGLLFASESCAVLGVIFIV